MKRAAGRVLPVLPDARPAAGSPSVSGMTQSELNIIMRALGRLEGKVDTLSEQHSELREDVDSLADAAKVARGIAKSRARFFARVGAVLLVAAALTTAGTGIVVYWANTTHPPHDSQTVIVKVP